MFIKISKSISFILSCLEQAVTLLISRALPSLSKDKVSAVSSLIMAEEPELKDLLYMKAEDFTSQLTKLQARKLISFFEENFPHGNSQANTEITSILDFPVIGTTQSESLPSTSKEIQNGNSVPLTIKINESWASNFEIPYDKFPPQVIKKCQGELRPNPEERAHVIRILAYEIAKISQKPGKKKLEIIAAKMIKEFPKSFQDVISDQPFGNGYASLLHSLVIRFDNVNRKKQDSLKSLTKDCDAKKKKQKKCINYQPDHFPDKETGDTQKNKKEWLQNQFLENVDNFEISESMIETFASQRLTINSVTTVNDVIKQWPYLTRVKYLLKHFELAMQPYDADWESIFQKKIPELLDFLKNKVQAKSFDVDGRDDVSAVLFLLCSYFKEENEIVQFYRECECIDDVPKDCPVTPFIAIFGDKSAVVFAEREKFSEYITPSDAFKVWFALFYVFNMVYPASCPATMEFVQRGLMEIALMGPAVEVELRNL